MENLEDVKLLHDKVQNDIFRILVKYKVIAHVSSTLNSRVPLYFIAEEYKFMFYELPSEVHVFIASINRLLETGYVKVISDPANLNTYLLIKPELDTFTDSEKKYFIVLPEKNFTNLLERQPTFSFLDEIL